jgi:hypothetical protein
MRPPAFGHRDAKLGRAVNVFAPAWPSAGIGDGDIVQNLRGSLGALWRRGFEQAL